MYRGLILIFIFTGVTGYGQNLVPNPYFDEVPNCNRGSSDDFFADWFNPTASKRNKAFHQCRNNIPYSPHELNSFLYPKTGSGMMSIEIFHDQYKDSRSYISTKLKKKMKAGIPYYIRFFVSPMPEEPYARRIVADAIGIRLSNEVIRQDTKSILPYQAQVEHAGEFFDEYLRWYQIRGKYIAQGGEEIATIGNFRPDSLTQFKYLKFETGSVPNMAEVFIDDVLIEAFDPFPDTIMVCEEDSVVLDAAFHESEYLWNTGAESSRITVSRSGKYKISAKIDTLIFEDSVRIIFMKDLKDIMEADTFLCSGESLILQAPVPGQYKWSTGDTGFALQIRDAGTYQLSAETECGTVDYIYNVESVVCDCELIFPSAFSPNGDGQNDIFAPVDYCHGGRQKVISFSVFDKWGGVVFQSRSGEAVWDGQSTDGQTLPPGIYVYKVEVGNQASREEEFSVKSGTIHLLR